ncbi:hypothetical protein [Cryobacterium fucosi]|uniref:hypothetical protein n=1 Tax=Cryobacterium fucosi TaxID=1259157 RepID=UPI001F5445AC|nr:hypothetical protein [Cryobacterium fucosi]
MFRFTGTPELSVVKIAPERGAAAADNAGIVSSEMAATAVKRDSFLNMSGSDRVRAEFISCQDGKDTMSALNVSVEPV